MRRFALMVVMSMMLLSLAATPADAAWRGRRCQDYPSPNGGGRFHRVCALVNQNDISQSIQGLIQYGSSVQPLGGSGASEIYIDWIVLIMDGSVIKRVDPDRWIPAGNACCPSSATGWTGAFYGHKFKAQAAFKLKWKPNGVVTCCHTVTSNTWLDAG